MDDRILFIDNGTGKIQAQFDCISAGVSTELLGGMCMLSHGILYLEEQGRELYGTRFAETLLMGNLSADLVSYDIIELVVEEAKVYFAGDCSVEEAVEKIQNRVGVLLAE